MSRRRNKDERLPTGSVIFWSRPREKRKGRRHVWVRCGGCGWERIVDARNVSNKTFTGLCPDCGHTTRRRRTDETLSTGSVVLWSNRFRKRGCWYVPVICGDCGEKRTIRASSASGKDFTGLCRRCSDTTPNPAIDETLPTGSVILWSKGCETWKSRSCVWVRCKCGEERMVSTQYARCKDFTGLCQRCGIIANRKCTRTGAEVLPTGSIIYWDNETHNKYKQRAILVRCGGPFCGGYARYILLSEINRKGFTGLCNKCRAGRKGGRITKDGYILVRIPPDHPFSCMANKNGYVYEHRLIMAEKLGRPLTSDEIVNHRNRIKDDNRLENLELCTRIKQWERTGHHAGYHPVKIVTDPDAKGLIAFLKRLFP